MPVEYVFLTQSVASDDTLCFPGTDGSGQVHQGHVGIGRAVLPNQVHDRSHLAASLDFGTGELTSRGVAVEHMRIDAQFYIWQAGNGSTPSPIRIQTELYSVFANGLLPIEVSERVESLDLGARSGRLKRFRPKDGSWR